MRHELAPSRRVPASGAPGRAEAEPAVDERWLWRSVLILRPGDRLDPGTLRRSIQPAGPPLLLLCVGYPPTPEQRRATGALLGLAAERGVPAEARLAWTMDEALDVLTPLDELVPCLVPGSPVPEGAPIGWP
jgi:hypothetical protein